MVRYGLVLTLLISGAAGRGIAQRPDDELGKRTSEAVAGGLKFLATTQEKNGSWTVQNRRPHAAITALSVRAFLSAGHAPGQGPYGETIEKGIRAVLKLQMPGGLLATDPSAEMYHHGICTLMLAEAAGKTKGDLADDVKKSLEKAVRVILQAQRKQEGPTRGGWRYRTTGTDADMSITGWQIAALRAAKDAGCEVPAEAFERALGFVKRCRDPRTGAYTYTVGGGPTVPCTASAVAALAACGEKVKDLEEARKAGDYILKGRPPLNHFHYLQYHSARAAHLLGGNYWTTSRKQVFEALLTAQTKAGSWQANEGYGSHYATAMAVLALSVETSPLPDGKEKPGGK